MCDGLEKIRKDRVGEQAHLLLETDSLVSNKQVWKNQYRIPEAQNKRIGNLLEGSVHNLFMGCMGDKHLSVFPILFHKVHVCRSNTQSSKLEKSKSHLHTKHKEDKEDGANPKFFRIIVPINGKKLETTSWLNTKQQSNTYRHSELTMDKRRALMICRNLGNKTSSA